MDASGYQVSGLEDIEFHWDDLDVKMDAIFGTDIKTPFSNAILNHFEMESMAEKPILMDEEQVAENSPPLPTTPLSERPIQPWINEKSTIINKNWNCSRMCP